MQAVVLAAGRGTRLRPFTNEKPKGMVEIQGQPILTYCFDQLLSLNIDELVVVVGYKKEDIIRHYCHEFNGVPITYIYQREQKGLAHAVLLTEAHISGDFIVMLGDTIFEANLHDVLYRQQQTDSDAAFLVEEVPKKEARRYGVCDVNSNGEIIGVVEKPTDPSSNLVMAGFYVFTPMIFHACSLLQPSNRGEYELSEAIDLLIKSGRKTTAIGMKGWRIDVGYPEDRYEAERRLQQGTTRHTLLNRDDII